MKLSDLKTGMIVTLRNGDEYVVFTDFSELYTEATSIICNGKSWINLCYYSDGMKCSSGCLGNMHDIVKVEIPYHPYSIQKPSYEKDKRKILYDGIVKEVTMAEIEEKFGCKVKIVKED